MSESLPAAVLLPLGLGLIGFLEPCTIGSTLLFVKAMEGRPAAVKLAQLGVFVLARALLIGLLGATAVLVGSAFIGFQKAMWVGLGALYAALGVLLVAGRGASVARALGPSLARLGEVRGSAALGALFGLNIPACAAPLLFALLGVAAAGGVSGATLAQAPLALAVLVPSARRALDRLAGLSRRVPRWSGIVLIALGAWSVWFGLYVTPRP
jgi:cytochrome c-type biogenesis protein